jgi:phosphohistidine phosphatase
LVLLRHAKAEPIGSGADRQRPLALAGRSQAIAVGGALAESGVVPDVVLCSSALRTRQTWELVASHLSGSAHLDVVDELYDVTVRELLAVLHTVPDEARTVLVVGHEPTMSTAAGVLADADSDAAAVAQAHVGLPTSAYAVLESPSTWSDWDRGTARLAYVGRPPED